MPKREAANQITRDAVEAGLSDSDGEADTMKPASAEVMAARKVFKAKRTPNTSPDKQKEEESSSGGIFAGLADIKSGDTSSSPNLFSGLPSLGSNTSGGGLFSMGATTGSGSNGFALNTGSNPAINKEDTFNSQAIPSPVLSPSLAG